MPTANAITAALSSATRKLFKRDPENVTVNLVREAAADELGVDPNFFKNGEWKGKSKDFIRGEVEILQSAPTPQPSPEKPKPKPKATPAPKPKAAPKKSAPARKAAPPPRKRQKKSVTPSEDDLSDVLSDDDEEVSVADDSDESEEADFTDESDAPKRKRGRNGSLRKVRPKAKQASRRGSAKKKVESEDEEEEESEGASTPSASEEDESKEVKPKKAAPKAKALSKKAQTPPESENKVDEDDEEQDESGPQSAEKDDPPKSTENAEQSDSEMSVLIDEPVKPRRSKSASREATTSKPRTKAAAKPAKDLSPQEQEIKTLQSHLLKCGVRKIWQFELKDYGDDNAAKIRHLKGMLRDVGMVGRFSEARAREIKEMRELQEDLEAVKQGEEAWGVEGRASRRRSSAAKAKEKVKRAVSEQVGSGSEDGADPEEEEEEESEEDFLPVREKGKGARRDDLAFLGDEESSDEE